MTKILFPGEEKCLDEIFGQLKNEMILKRRTKSVFAENDDEHCTVLYRLIDLKMDESGTVILSEPDPRHVELLLEDLELSGTKSKGVNTSGEKSVS